MKKFIKGFQNINNQTGGMYGFKKVKVTDDIASMMSAFESGNSVQVIKYGPSGASVIKNGYDKMKLKKRNNDTFLSKKQIQYFNYNKKTYCYYYSSKRVVKSHTDTKKKQITNPQRFILAK